MNHLRLAYNELDTVAELFEEYKNALGVDLAFQDYSQEIHTLPGKYALPRGRLYLIDAQEKVAGCVALKPLNTRDCEMKRLYVRPEFRRAGLGRLLAEKVIADAREMRYGKIYLDTLPSLTEAIKLYHTIGFGETASYYNNPLENAIYMCLKL